jgi:hypothetical protein
MPSVFLSHSSADIEFVERLTADLRNQGWNAQTFRDVAPDVQLEAGTLDTRIIRAIKEGSFFVPVLSPQALNSPLFNWEIEIAVTSEEVGDRVNILPALKEECLLPTSLGLRTPSDFSTSYQLGLRSLLSKLSVPLISSPRPSSNKGSNQPNIQIVLKELRSEYKALFSLSPTKLGELVASVFETHGYQVELSKRSVDGGIDLFVLGIKDSKRHPFMLECKRYLRGKRFGIEPVESISEIGEGDPSRRFLISTTHLPHVPPREGYQWLGNQVARSRWDLSFDDYSAVIVWLSGYPELGSELTKPIDQARKRYAELIDRKFISTLSSDELTELTRLEELMDEAEAPQYEETIRRLTEIRDRLSTP